MACLRGQRRQPPAGALTRCVLLLVLDRRDVAEFGVEPVVVVPADPLDDRELELVAGAPASELIPANPSEEGRSEQRGNNAAGDLRTGR